MNRLIDLLLYVVYANGLVMAAFDAQGRANWRRWWLAKRPSVVAIHDRSPGVRRASRSPGARWVRAAAMSERLGLKLIATTIYTWTDGSHVRWFTALHYGHPAMFVRGYVGDTYDLGTLRRLVDRGGRDLSKFEAMA